MTGENTVQDGPLLKRLPTGIPGLDEILTGGLIAGRCYLLVGQAGGGKTIFSLQWLQEMERRQMQTLFITLAEPAVEIRANMSTFGWKLDGIELLDLSPAEELDDAASDDYHIFPPSEVEQVPTWGAIYRAVKQRKPQCLVLDSLTQLRYLSTDEYQFRKKILSLVTYLNRTQCTTLMTFESSELEHESGVALAVDGLLRLRCDISPSRTIALRGLQVDKFRGSDFLSGFHALRITSQGIVLFPHRVERTCPNLLSDFKLSSGSAELDKLLGGGLESHTTTIISGPPGVGKTTIGVEFLHAAVERGERAVLFSFEESVESIVFRAQATGTPIQPFLASGSLRIVRTNVLEQFPDEFLAQVRAAVEQAGVTLIMIDSLSGYQMEMEQFGSPLAHIHNLINYLHRHEVSCILINEFDYITGDVATSELGVSHLSDNIIMLRYAESRGQIVKVVACLKKRGGNFQPELREMVIGARGVRVGAKLGHLRGILTGIPVWRPESNESS